MKKKTKIVKKKPIWLYECNTFQVNGCEMYCTEYVKGVPYHACKHHKILCKLLEGDLNKI